MSKDKLTPLFALKFGTFILTCFFSFNWDSTPCKAKQPIQGMKEKEKEAQKD